MGTIQILNIPSYVSSYYLAGLNEIGRFEYEPNEEFRKWNGTPILILRIGKKNIVIDNHDPIGVQQGLYDEAALYYTTNKLKEKPDYNLPKVRALFPHYPVNLWWLYKKLFGFDWYRECGLEKVLRDISAHTKRPPYRNFKNTYEFTNYIFFSGSIWKKEGEANIQRAQFIKTCRSNSTINFEGGLVPRKEGNFSQLDEALGTKRYSWKEFEKKSSRSMVNFNNPAVLGAISWRVGEYLNLGTFLLSLPWKIYLPVFPIHGEEIHMIEDTREIPELFKFLLRNPTYHKKVASGGKKYFHNNCTPRSQILRIYKDITQDF
ncbi:glycosyltransferase [Salinimicrobium sp. WS361]|uniref:glycosyltransferase n=1 Tax=Salinimicrobium sp. WS361 TaxID=3425123 RepID=UPI003D6E0F19